jgi:aspartyl-tRNA(Asn)/glutamyl-tRNA(Gln) amidotransferase subunit C
MLKKTDIEHIAKLARLKLTENEKKQIGEELSSVLNYIEELKEVNIDKVSPVSHSINITNVVREDKSFPLNPENRKKLLDSAPSVKDKLIKVKAVFND